MHKFDDFAGKISDRYDQRSFNMTHMTQLNSLPIVLKYYDTFLNTFYMQTFIYRLEKLNI